MLFFDNFDKSLIVLSATNGSISIASLATVIGAPAVIASAIFSLAFSMYKHIVRKFLETTRNTMKKHNKIIMFARSKWNSIESEISEAFINNKISHEDFTTIINEEKNYRELKENFRIIKTQRSDTGKGNLIEESKRKDINQIIRGNE